MKTLFNSEKISALGVTASVFGILAGIGGLLHGVGEMLQGNVPTEGIIIESWTSGPIAEHMDGDPALTIIPNTLVTGITASIISLAVIIWSLWYVRRKRGGLILFLLTVALFLTGGGFGPPTLGILAGIAGIGIDSKHKRFRSFLPARLRKYLASAWPWIFSFCALTGVFLVIGHIVLVFVFGVTNSELFLYSFFLTVLFLVPGILAGIAYDIRGDEQIMRSKRPAAGSKG